jgi:CheY-like chemotaxis protein
MGIPAKMLPHVFDMFTQVDRTLERSQGGLGIGLTLVKRLVEMHDGRIEAHSDGEGCGSVFVVRLPAVRVRPAQESGQAAGTGGPATNLSPKHHILVVDDNKDSANSLAMMLRLMGNEVYVAHDGVAGVEAAASFQPGIVFLDIGMPKMNGYEAARRMRELHCGHNMVLVALSGWGQHDARRRSQEAGFDQHLVKPVDPAALEKLLVAAERRST